ncbi:MAG: hypothetical protein KAJ07_09540 [Planctomycetes bacterium]|nr:hypothetical protein [Planctomycetota bacterium]
MAEYDNNEFEIDPEQVEASLDADAKPLCLDCLCECNPLSYYCQHCSSFNPINPLAAYIPFVRLRFHYGLYCTAWRRIWHDKDISNAFRILLILFVSFYMPLVAIVGLVFLFLYKDSTPGVSTKLKISLTITMVLFIVLRILPHVVAIVLPIR